MQRYKNYLINIFNNNLGRFEIRTKSKLSKAAIDLFDLLKEFEKLHNV